MATPRLSGEHDTQNNPATTTTLMLTLIHSGSRQPSHNSRLWELESWFLFDWIKWGTEMAVYFVCFPRRPPICVCNVSSWSTSGDDNRVSRTLTRGHCYRFSLCTKPLNKYCYILYKIPELTLLSLVTFPVFNFLWNIFIIYSRWFTIAPCRTWVSLAVHTCSLLI